MIHIIAIDPGKISGFSTYTVSDPSNIRCSAQYATFELPKDQLLERVEYTLSAATMYGSTPVLVYERFVEQQRTHRLSAQPDARDIIGQLRAMCRVRDIRCDAQNVSEAKRIGKTALLKRLNMWTSTKDGHSNDSAKHVLFALLRIWPNEMAALLTGDRIISRLMNE